MTELDGTTPPRSGAGRQGVAVSREPADGGRTTRNERAAMCRTALTVAITGALPAPMAAQAVAFTLSGHLNRALIITDSDDDSRNMATVADNGSSGSRIRVSGESEMMAGGSAGLLLEYGAGDTLGLRHADVWFSGDFGTVSIGHSDRGGVDSVYSDMSDVTGIGHGQETGAAAVGDYYGSLDAGGDRNNRIRYEAPRSVPSRRASRSATVTCSRPVSESVRTSAAPRSPRPSAPSGIREDRRQSAVRPV